MKKYQWVLLALLWHVNPCMAQKAGWQHLDLQRDTVLGISTEKAYAELLKGKKPRKVIVGIIDSGVDTAQEDLRPVLWTDPVRGVHGWNFIGAETGREDITNLVRPKKTFYDSLAFTLVPLPYRAGYQQYRKLSPQLDGKIDGMRGFVEETEDIRKSVDKLLHKTGKDSLTAEDLRNYKSTDGGEHYLVQRISSKLSLYSSWKDFYYGEITHLPDMAEYHLSHGLNVDNTEADSARGDADVSPDKLGLVFFPNMTAWHGTHVAGIIGAVRGNGIGMDGIADDVQIMMLKANGTIRELRDKSLVLGIRFAVDHGAKVINLSFGKPYTWDKKAVDEAVRYAMAHDVLLVHAAGNDGADIDVQEHYPNPIYLDGGHAAAWIEVGASGGKDDSTLAASFSNYGKRDVDVFAPGVAIYSTLPFNQYQAWEGTSMAAPVVAGLAALIREYYPRLTAVQVKTIIMQSVVKRQVLVDKCVSGGVVNAYNALKLAEGYQ